MPRRPSSTYKIKTERLDQGGGHIPEIQILNKIVRMTSDGVGLEADPRHAELMVQELGLEGAKASLVPGSKDEVKKADKGIDGVKKAKDSARGGTCEFEADVDSGTVDDAELLGPEDARLYRGSTAIFNDIAPNRPDVAYAVKESARGMSAPRASALRRLRNIGKYLIGSPGLASK